MSTTQQNGAIAASVDHLTAFDLEALTAHECAIVGIVAQVRANGEAAPLRAWAREGGGALERVREALNVLGELDLQLLVELAIDGLVRAHVDDRSAIPQSR